MTGGAAGATSLPWDERDLPCVTIGNARKTKNARISANSELLLTLSVPNVLLCKWHYEKQQKLICVLNASVIQHAVAIRENCERLETHLQALCRKVGSLYRSTTGRKKRSILEGQTNIFVLNGETVPYDEHSTLLEDFATVVLKCEGLESEIDNLREALIAQAQKQHHETHNELVLMNRGRRLDELSTR